MSEWKNLGKVAMVLGTLAIVVLILIVVISRFGYTLRSEAETDINITLGLTNASVAIGTAGQYPFPQSTIDCVNSTGQRTMNDSVLRISEGQTADGGTMTLLYNNGLNDDFQGYIVDCDITYLASTTGSQSADNFITAMTYFGLFAGILALAFLGWIVIKHFSMGKAGGKL